MAQINLRVDDDTKREWKHAVSESREYASLTHLVQLSVLRELNRDDDSETSDKADISPVLDLLETLSEDIETMSSDISDIQVSIRDDERKSRLRADILDLMRNEATLSGFQSAAEVDDDSGSIVDDGDGIGPATAEDIADELGEPHGRVANALEWLVDNYGMVVKVNTEGNAPCYMRDDTASGVTR